MAATIHNPGAGIGDPYWYEWSIGLQYVLDLLDPTSEVTSVTLQATGKKGLDDVVVRFSDGRARFIQVKHTRVEDSITFGDFVTAEENDKSLLRQMADAWTAVGEPAEVWLVTNREAGTRASRPRGESPITRPPLTKFLGWLSEAVAAASSMTDISVRPEWEEAWNKEWLPQLEGLDTDEKKLRFLQALEVRHSQDELGDLGAALTERIGTLFSVKHDIAEGLRARLDSELRTWATSLRGAQEAITREAAYAALCLVEDRPVGEHDLAPPAPFFPTRLPVTDETKMLVGERRTAIVFVTGEPGSGKTAVLSQVANQRESAIGARFHAYRPITPENKLLPPDAGRTSTPRALWSDLLIQLRALVRGRLAALQVPVHAASLTVEKLREHVLRIASAAPELAMLATSLRTLRWKQNWIARSRCSDTTRGLAGLRASLYRGSRKLSCQQPIPTCSSRLRLLILVPRSGQSMDNSTRG